MTPNMVYRGMWEHLTGRSRLLQDFRDQNQEYDGWANQADLMLDASITKEYYSQFLRYLGKEDMYTELIRPAATGIVPPAVDDFSELPPLANSSRDTGQATVFQKSMTIELEQTGTLPPNVELFRVWREIAGSKSRRFHRVVSLQGGGARRHTGEQHWVVAILITCISLGR